MRRTTLFGLGVGASLVAAFACGGGDDGGGGASSSGSSSGDRPDSSVAPDGSVEPSDACKPAGSGGPVQKPVFVRNVVTQETGWFGSPAVVDLDKDGKKEIVATLYSTMVFDAAGNRLAKATATKGRIYAPGVVADLDGDGTTEIVVGGNEGTVTAYEWKGGKLETKAGWPASTCSGGQCPEARGMAAGDLDGDGKIEVAVTTTNTAATGAQVFVFSPDGKLFAPSGKTGSWPRYDYKTPGDGDFNGQGNQGYGCFGQNVGIGNVDDDPQLEVIATYDNHQINAFKADGTSILASDWYTNRATKYDGKRFGWGQFIRWLDPKVEDDHYHLHVGEWPDVKTTMWLQWTASPPNVVDVDGDGKNEVVGIPNAEMKEPYETQGYAFMVLSGAQSGGARAARRAPGFETLPMSGKPTVRADDDYYPPSGIPAPTTVSVLGDKKPEIVAAINDGFVYAIGEGGKVLFKYDFAKGAPKTFASEVVVADLNADGRPELVFGTYSLETDGGHIVVLANTGELLFDVPLPNQGKNGNGIGIPAAPTIADLDGDGTLEILVQTFDHGIDVFTVPGSKDNCVLWPTSRGGLLRAGTSAWTAK